MKLTDFDFTLPDALIATRPAVPRSSARLLVSGPEGVTDATVGDLPDWLRPGDRLVLNDTRVIPARLTGRRHREGGAGARIEVTLLEPRTDGTWAALVKPLRKLRPGETVIFSNALSAVLEDVSEGQGHLRFNLAGEDFDAALAEAGQMPPSGPPTTRTAPTTRPSGPACPALSPRPPPRCTWTRRCWPACAPGAWISPM